MQIVKPCHFTKKKRGYETMDRSITPFTYRKRYVNWLHEGCRKSSPDHKCLKRYMNRYAFSTIILPLQSVLLDEDLHHRHPSPDAVFHE